MGALSRYLRSFYSDSSHPYAVAVTAVAVATAVRGLLDPWLESHVPFITYHVAILVSGLWGGASAAALAVLAGLIVGDVLFIPPRGLPGIETTEQLAGVITYLIVGSTIGWLAQNQRKAYLRNQASLRAAEREVQERKLIEHALGERVKELKTLHTFAQLLLNQEMSVPTLLQTLVGLLPDGWQYPEITAARIVYREQVYATSRFTPTPYSQQAGFTLQDGSSGIIEVVYLEGRPDESEGPFLLEERHLIDSLAELLRSALDRRNVKAALLGSIQKYESLVANIPDVIWTGDAEGRTTFISPGIERVFGFTPEEVYAAGSEIWLGRIHPDDVGRVQAAYQDLFRKNKRFEAEYRIQRKDGAWIWLQDRSVQTYISKNGVRYADGTFRDITEQKRAEAALQELNETLEAQVKERTAALLKKKQKLRGLAVELSRTEVRERKRLATELHDNLAQLLALCKIKLAAVQDDSTHRSNVYRDVKALLDDALRYTRTLMADLGPSLLGNEQDLPRAISWVAEKMQRLGLSVAISDDGVPKVLTEEALTVTYQVVRELLCNVAKHAKTNNAMVMLERVGNELHATVMDQGIGFDVTAARTLSQEGGFGLFNVQERVLSLGGRVIMTSVPGQGTCAMLAMPLRPEPASLQQHGSAPALLSDSSSVDVPHPSTSKRIRVLLVDDHALVRQGLRTILEEAEDLEITGEAGDGEEALDKVRQCHPDVVLMDVNMPKMSGIDATRLIKADFPQVAIIGLSMLEDEKIAHDMLSAGATAYLSKGGSLESLRAAITHAKRPFNSVAP